MDRENIHITGFGKQYGMRISTPEHRSYNFKYLPVEDTNEVRLGIGHINTDAGLIELIIRYMKHCSQECEIDTDEEELRFYYTTSTSQ